jgi:hypothetical protein
LKERRKRG